MGAILAKRLRAELGNGASVRVRKSDYRDYLHVFVTSARFARERMEDRGARIWRWLEQDLSPQELAKITLVMALTPSEERDFLSSAR